ncbi:hypothetical protein BDK51DRAFT_32417 [Blyttiomyces helicus]|uniref:Uncharacterized protein n=1 Tax=Blyttiomyces helicus TaxID=388810 RepID=A0A4P9WH20_9FUNG|nr:hypothetical protein BDK51DRAFT_32417 [Blyttiomyces helicus]|eukprot:RKO89816.1 hypothetical protein BDK51DRAFT_32417 [Blyttiomyces helicus]
MDLSSNSPQLLGRPSSVNRRVSRASRSQSVADQPDLDFEEARRQLELQQDHVSFRLPDLYRSHLRRLELRAEAAQNPVTVPTRILFANFTRPQYRQPKKVALKPIYKAPLPEWQKKPVVPPRKNRALNILKQGPMRFKDAPVKRDSRPTTGVMWDGDEADRVRDSRASYATPTYASLARRSPAASKVLDQKAGRSPWSGLFSRGSPRSAGGKEFGARTASASSGETLGAPNEREDSGDLMFSPIMSRRESRIMREEDGVGSRYSRRESRTMRDSVVQVTVEERAELPIMILAPTASCAAFASAAVSRSPSRYPLADYGGMRSRAGSLSRNFHGSMMLLRGGTADFHGSMMWADVKSRIVTHQPRPRSKKIRTHITVETPARRAQLDEVDRISASFARHNMEPPRKLLERALLRPEEVVRTPPVRPPAPPASHALHARIDTPKVESVTSDESTDDDADAVDGRPQSNKRRARKRHHAATPLAIQSLLARPLIRASSSDQLLDEAGKVTAPRINSWWSRAEYRAMRKRFAKLKDQRAHEKFMEKLMRDHTQKPFNAFITSRPRTAESATRDSKYRPITQNADREGASGPRRAEAPIPGAVEYMSWVPAATPRPTHRPLSASSSIFGGGWGGAETVARRRTQSERPQSRNSDFSLPSHARATSVGNDSFSSLWAR